MFNVAPSGVPESFDAMEINLTSITLQWMAVECFQQNSEIMEYMITYETIKINVSSTMMELIVRDLLPNTHYTFSIFALSEFGVGPIKNTTGQTTSPNGSLVYVPFLKEIIKLHIMH